MANHPLQSSGPISLNDISMEFNRTSGSVASLNDAKSGAYGVIKTANNPNPVTGNNSITGQPKNGLHITDWYGYNHLVSIFGAGFNGTILTITVQSDNKILIGGSFTTYKGVTRNRIIRINPDGTEDSTFVTNIGTGIDANVNNITVQPDGKILVVGGFSQLNGTARNRIVRLNSDGTVDTAFYTNLGTGVNSTVGYTAIQPADNKILIGGSFTLFKGVTRNYLIRLNSDGTEDTTFYTNLSTSFNATVNVIVVQSNASILVAGQFTLFKGVTRNYLVRLTSTGTEDTAFYTNLGTAFNNSINGMKVQPDGDILVGGNFTTFKGVARTNMVRLNSDGTEDTAFYSNLGTGVNGPVNTFIVQPDNKIVIGGGFTTYKGSPRAGMIRVNSDGTDDFIFLSYVGSGTNNTVWASVIQTGSSNNIIFGGQFTTYSSNNVGRIAQLNSAGGFLG